MIGLEHGQALRPNGVAYLDPQCRVNVPQTSLKSFPDLQILSQGNGTFESLDLRSCSDVGQKCTLEARLI